MANVSISIDVADLDLATRFYTGALGCEMLRKQGETMVVLDAGGAQIYLLERAPGSEPVPGAQSPRAYGRHWTPVHLDFQTDDVDASVQRVVAEGGTHEGGEKGKWGAIAYCADPFGHGFCVIREAAS